MVLVYNLYGSEICSKNMVIEDKRVPTLSQPLFPVLEVLPCLRTKKDLSLGELIYGVSNTILCVF